MKLSLFTLITLVSIISSQIAPGSQPTNPVVDPTNITAPVDDPKANRVRPPSIIIGQNLTAPLRMGPFSLKNWGFLQLPGSINLGRGQSLTSVYNPKLSNGYQNAYFYVSPLGDAYVFNTVIGTIRAVYWEGSIYARTELSETDSTNGTASWDATTGVHNFEVTQSVNAFTSFVSGKVIVMEMKSNLCPQCVDFYLKADAHSNPNGATLTAFFPQASNPTKPLKYVVDTNVQIGVKYQARLLVSNGRMHFYYNKVEYTPIEGIQTNDTSAFFKFGSWAQSRPHDNDPAGSFDQVWTYSATASHTTTSGNDIGAQQVIPNIPGVVGQQAKSGSISNTIGLLSILEIGAGLTASGVFFMILGVILLFDGGLLAIGNVKTEYLIK
ncbi:hypothetical protein HDU92_001928 [Lobulomyces angularis]|nr:hypothetical protein HDU92_001928 [Lobulomyces angularis]